MIWRHYTGLSRWVQCDHEGSYNREAKTSKSEKEDVKSKAKIGVTALKNVEGAVSQGISWPAESEKEKEVFLS